MSSKCKQYCSVPQCNNYRTENITVHKFPMDLKLKEKWRIALKIGKAVTRGMMVCSEHFLSTDFHLATEYTKKRFLKKNVVPSLKIPQRVHDRPQPSSSIARSQRAERRTTTKVTCTPDTEHITESEMEVEVSDENIISPKDPATSFVDVAIQVNTSSNAPQFSYANYLLESSFRLSSYTGVNIPIFQLIFKLVSNTLTACHTVENKNIKKKICLVLTKFKLDLSFRALGVMYGISSTTAQNYFHQYVQILYYSLRQAIYFTSKEENLRNLPQCFKKYRNVRIVIDATEIPIQKAKCLQCRIRSYSHYKKSHTAKFLISICPAGIICHVSSAYGGRVSDKAIFNAEKIIDKLDSYHDAVMVDKGILIENECMENGITLIRPPFLRKKAQLSKEEALETASIARARVHVERTIQRIKIFKIFTNRLDWTLVPYLDEMMTIVCAIVNLSKPILSDDKF